MDENQSTSHDEGKEKVVFTPPASFSSPEGDSDTFDLVCTFRKEEGGKLCLVKLGDTDMYEKREPERKPNYASIMKDAPTPDGLAGGMGGGGAGGY